MLHWKLRRTRQPHPQLALQGCPPGSTRFSHSSWAATAAPSSRAPSQAAASHHNHPKIIQATQRGVLLSECLHKLLQLSERCKARLLTLCKDTLSFLLVLPSAHVILLRLQGNHVCRSNTIALQAGFFPQEQRHLKKAAAQPRMPK